MNLYKVSCYSQFGSYFAAYLQSVTVCADDKESAITAVKKWMEEEGSKFVRPEEFWQVEALSPIGQGVVVDYHRDSDY